MARDRAETGEFTESITLAAVVDAIRRAEGPVVTTGDVADALDCSTEAARPKLTALAETGRVDRGTAGARAVVWWLTERETITTEIDAEDPLLSGAALFAGDEPIDEDEIDEDEIDDVVYGDA